MIYSHPITDHENARDALGRERLAQSIASQVRKEKPSVIGVYGSWGAGKSHLLSQVLNKIFQDNQQAENKLVACVFEAWRYEMEGDLAAGMIKSLANIEKDLVGYNPRLRGAYYKKAGLALLGFISKLAPYAGPGGKLVADGAELLQSILGMAEKASQKPDIGDLLPNVDKIKKQMSELVLAIIRAAKDADSAHEYRLVIFIDDLDRCSPENMVRMFEWLKVHLLVDKVTYVMALDNHAAARAIVGQYKKYLSQDEDLAYGLRYLEKLVDLEYDLSAPKGVEAMALDQLGRELCQKWEYQRVSQYLTGPQGTGGDFPGCKGVDELLGMHSVSAPRTMLKIVKKLSLCLDVLASEPARELRQSLPASFPFWLVFLIAVYYRLEPEVLREFIRKRGVLIELIAGGAKAPGPAAWGSGPMYEFCVFAQRFGKFTGQSVKTPTREQLARLTRIMRENVI